MAATPSKLSPSNQSVEVDCETSAPVASSNSDAKPASLATTSATSATTSATSATTTAVLPVTTLKDPPPSSAPPAPSVTAATPTYSSSESSRYYKIAKTLLADGDFETALATIEEGIEATKADLAVSLLPSTDHADDTTESDQHTMLHESLAPFHYLYGTTLLYSIEESTDGAQPMTNPVEADGTGVSAVAAGPDEDNHDNTNSNAMAAVEDMEIAWENLDTARTILERMLPKAAPPPVPASEQPQSSPQPQPFYHKLRADLAQVHLREGDLQRQNGAYDAAVADYQACLRHRTDNPTVATFSRKIADVHYNLGLVCFNRVAAATTTDSAERRGAAATTTPPSPAVLNQARRQGFHHYYHCGRVFGGIVADLCGMDPDQVLHEADTTFASLKRTGDDDDDDNDNNDTKAHSKLQSLKLAHLRTVLSKLTVPEAVQLDVEDCTCVLDEIQETMDEADNSEKGVHEVTAMKEQIAAAVAAQASLDDTAAAGAAKDNPADAAGTTTIGFGAAAADAAVVAVQPVTMMIKKKKKKRSVDEEGEDAALPAKQDTNVKRAKSE